MKTREEAIKYGLSLPDTYQEAPFHDDNWQLVRIRGSKKAFLWTYERDGYINLNVKVDPEWRDLWRNAYEAVKKIPKGKVATYGQIAALAGEPKMARAVGNALHKNPDPDNIPCFRVVNAQGKLSGEFAFGGVGAQARLLEADGIEVADGKVDLDKYAIKVEEYI